MHGLATAYYLARNHGMTDVAVLDKAYLGSGGSGRNTAIVRSNYLTPEGVAFYDRSVHLYEQMAVELNINVMFSQRGHLTLAHSDASLRTMHWRAEVNKLGGVNSSVIGPDEIKKECPSLDTSDHPRYPIQGALYHPPGGVVRHDAVVWGYARAADHMGVEMHQRTEVTDILCEGGDGPDGKGAGGRVTGVRTNRGDISTPIVINCNRRLGIAHLDDGRRAAAHHHPPAAGRRHRAGEDVPADGGGFGLAARVRQPDRPGRAGIRCFG